MSGFDIRSILDFKPPRFICASCRGLFRDFEYSNRGDVWDKPGICPVCKKEYVRGQYADERLTGQKYLRDQRLIVDYGKDLLQHATDLAELVTKAEHRSKFQDPWPTMRLLFAALSQARYFVHFASWGISHLLIGALKITSFRVPVYGFVSNVEEHARAELTEFTNEAPNLRAHAIASRAGAWDAPHQKLVVVDGLLAFKGSTNLTNNAIRKADRGLDVSELVTNFEEVAKLNNRFFAPVWQKLTDPDGRQVVMYEDVPF